MARVLLEIKVDGAISEPSSKGLRQVDGLACLLFNIVLERAVRKSGICTRGTIFNISTQPLAYCLGHMDRDIEKFYLPRIQTVN